MLHSDILASIKFNKNYILVPWIWEEPYIEMLFQQFSNTIGKLWDKSVPYFEQESGPCSLDWRTTIYLDTSLAIFKQPWYMWVCWKIDGTIFNVLLYSNPRDKIINPVEIYWSQDLIVQLIYLERRLISQKKTNLLSCWKNFFFEKYFT